MKKYQIYGGGCNESDRGEAGLAWAWFESWEKVDWPGYSGPTWKTRASARAAAEAQGFVAEDDGAV